MLIRTCVHMYVGVYLADLPCVHAGQTSSKHCEVLSTTHIHVHTYIPVPPEEIGTWGSSLIFIKFDG